MPGTAAPPRTVDLGRARVTARLLMDGEGRISRGFPVASGGLRLSAAGDVVLLGAEHRGAPRDIVRLDGGSVRAMSFGRTLRRSRQVRPWAEDEPRPSRVVHVFTRRVDVVLVVSDRPGHPGESILWGFDLWRAPDSAARAGIARLAAGRLPLAASVLPEEVHRTLVGVARSGGEPHGIVDMSQ